VATGITASPTLALGSHSLTLRVTDRAGASSTLPLSIQVIDTRPPTLGFDLSRHQLWPASHRMVEIHATVTAVDVCGPSSVVLMSIVSNEPADAPGPQDGFTSPDIADASLGTADFDFQLRAERLDTGDGRVYTVTYRATDASGNEATLPEQVIVPLRKGGKGSPTEGLFELHTPHSTATRR
jgi:hypothetical protein